MATGSQQPTISWLSTATGSQRPTTHWPSAASNSQLSASQQIPGSQQSTSSWSSAVTAPRQPPHPGHSNPSCLFPFVDGFAVHRIRNHQEPSLFYHRDHPHVTLATPPPFGPFTTPRSTQVLALPTRTRLLDCQLYTFQCTLNTTTPLKRDPYADII